jgi:hypothetical protein
MAICNHLYFVLELSVFDLLSCSLEPLHPELAHLRSVEPQRAASFGDPLLGNESNRGIPVDSVELNPNSGTLIVAECAARSFHEVKVHLRLGSYDQQYGGYAMSSTSLLVAAFSLAITTMAFGAEKQIGKPDLPTPVQKVADEQSAGATVRGYAKDIEDGKVEYEVKLTVEGHTKDVTMDSQGNLIEVEEQVTLDGLPAIVRNGLNARAGKGKITKVESLTKHGSIVAYEAQVAIGGKHLEIQVGPEGQKLDHEE